MNTLPDVILDRINRTNPTIGELVPQYVSVGFTKQRAVHLIVECYLASRLARGKGRNAMRRLRRMRDEAFERAEAIFRESQAYTAGYEDGLRDAKRVPRKVYGVLHPTNTERRDFIHVDSTGQRVEQF